MLKPLSRITGPGSPFELIETPIAGVPCRIFRRGPATLNDLYRKCAQFADREFMVFSASRVTTGEILEQAHVLACFLNEAAGVGFGTRVALVAGNSPHWLISFVAITSVGATAVLLPERSGVAEMARILDIADCTVVIADRDVARSLAEQDASRTILPCNPVDCLPGEVVERERAGLRAAHLPRAHQSLEIPPDTPALITFTSGTTGRPKGVVLTHRSMMTGLMNMLLGGALAAAKDTTKKPVVRNSSPVSLVLAPFSYISGYCNLLLMWYLGGRVVALPDPSVDAALDELETESVTALVGATPTLLVEILRSDRLTQLVASSLRSVNVHGGHMHPALRREVCAVLPNVTLGTGYGMTETNGSICAASGSVLIDRPLTCGQPLPTVDLKILRDDGSEAPRGEVGEIFVHGAMLMKEYCNWPEATARVLSDGWLRTGDLGRLDEEDYLELVDRVSDVLEYDGVRVSHSEIERVVIDGTLAREAVAMGIEDKRAGKTNLVLVVVPEPGQACDARRIAEQLLVAGVTGGSPPKILSVESLPRTASGKVDNRELRQRILAGTAQ